MVCTEVIKAATKKLHAEAEAVLIPRIKGIRSVEDYDNLLALFFGFFAPLEVQISIFIQPHVLPDIDKRRKSDSIAKSLSRGTSTSLAPPDLLPEINSLAQAFGAMYVLEGSTLGGKIISRMLQANTSVHLNSATLQFFDVYGEETVEMWDGFKTVMDGALTNNTDINLAAETAGETFNKMKIWMQKR